MNKDKLLCMLCGKCFSWSGELKTHQEVNHAHDTSQTTRTPGDAGALTEKLFVGEAETSKDGGIHDLASLDKDSIPDMAMERGRVVETQAYQESEGLSFDTTSANIWDSLELPKRVSDSGLDKSNPPSRLLEVSSTKVLFTYKPHGIGTGAALSENIDFGRNPPNDQSIRPRVCGSLSHSDSRMVSQHDLDLINGYKNKDSMFFADENFGFEEEGEYGW